MFIRKTLLVLASLSAGLFNMGAASDTKIFTVLPWNGHDAAVSLTFDDGDPIHLDVAVPEMQKRGQRGTFFLISDKVIRPDEWKKAAASGMEIGNHSANHKHAYELEQESVLKYELDDAENNLRKAYGQPVVAFAYPFVEITDGIRKHIGKYCIAARGGGPGVFYYTPDSKPDWYNIHSQATMSVYGYDTYKSWADTAAGSGAWTVFMIHAIEGSDWYQPVPKNIFLKLLDYLKENENKIWTAPFGEVAAYWKAQKALEGAAVKKDSSGYTVKWVKPGPFPEGVTVKIKLNSGSDTVKQAGKTPGKDRSGAFIISFDAGEMRIEKKAKRSGDEI